LTPWTSAVRAAIGSAQAVAEMPAQSSNAPMRGNSRKRSEGKSALKRVPGFSTDLVFIF